MRPKKVQEVYKKTADRLNLPEQYVKDLIEYYYMYNKSRMHTLSYVVFFISGLGRFRLRPKKFFERLGKMKELINKFGDRRDNRGIVIRGQLQERMKEFEDIEEEVERLRKLKNKEI